MVKKASVIEVRLCSFYHFRPADPRVQLFRWLGGEILQTWSDEADSAQELRDGRQSLMAARVPTAMMQRQESPSRWANVGSS